MNYFKKLIIASVVGILILGGITSCKKLDLINPNESTVNTFWVNKTAAVKGVNAIYAALGRPGTYMQWFYFVTDASSDLGFSTSPWTDLSNISKFTYTNYNFTVNYGTWNDHYRGIFRANQVLNYVPGIKMDTTLKNRLLGEAHFLKALFYYNLVNLYGNVPLATKLNVGADQLKGYRQEGIPAVWNLIEQDLLFAQKHLPTKYDAQNLGRATWGAATALLAKAYMQQHKYSEALPLFKEIVASGIYSLIPNYENNFRHTDENNAESIFEVQFSHQFDNGPWQDGTAGSSVGTDRARNFSPVGWSDVEATAYYVDIFKKYHDPRLNATYIYPNTTQKYYGLSYNAMPRTGGRVSNWFNKYTRSYYVDVAGARDWDSPINYRVIRYGGILLLYAEALHKTGNDTKALALVQQVRDRVGAGPSPFLSLGVGKVIEWERIFELSGESQRFFDMRRYGYFTDQNEINRIATIDYEFKHFRTATKGYLPIPTREIDLNPYVKQNPGW
ncbi:MAG: RagB/SusD family nutrient uptake outer membrane protein [Chlorobi bacterium]|nr:RagB/SusD family nutrient uptake outer membrane protein [Chlorobiota bacterium]